MAEERCALCKEAGQTNVLASYKGVPKGMSATGKAIPPVCYAHRNGTKPTWMSNEEWLEKKEPVLRNHAIGRPKVELNIETPARVEEALQLAGLSTSTVQTPPVNTKLGIQVKQPNMELKELVRPDAETDLGMVECLKRVSPNCEQKVSAAKIRQICSACWSFIHLNRKDKPVVDKPVVKDPGFARYDESQAAHKPLVSPISEPYQMPDETLEAMLEQVWESQDERIVVSVMQECFSDLPRSVQVRLVQTALQERKSRLPQPNSRANGDTDRPDMAFDAPGVRGPAIRQAEREKAAH